MWIQFLSQSNLRFQFDADDLPVTFGRSIKADVTIEDALLSRVHCELTFHDGRFVIRDLESTNGTVVNGRTVHDSELSSGDELILGTVQLEVQLGSESATVSGAEIGTVPDQDVYSS